MRFELLDWPENPVHLHLVKSVIHLRMIQCIKLTVIRTFCMIFKYWLFSFCFNSKRADCHADFSACLFGYKNVFPFRFALFNFQLNCVFNWIIPSDTNCFISDYLLFTIFELYVSVWTPMWEHKKEWECERKRNFE